MNRRSTLQKAVLAILLGLLLLSQPLQPAPATAAIAPALQAQFRSHPDARLPFFVLLDEQADLAPADGIDDWREKGRWVFQALQDTARRSQAPVERLLQPGSRLAREGHVDAWQPFWVVNAVWVQGDGQALEALARLPGVAQILPEIKLEPPAFMQATPAPQDGETPASVEWNIRQINADDVWRLGFRGQGMVVANLDTGVDYTHPALVRQYRGNLGDDFSGPFDHDYNWFDPFWNTTAPQALPSTSNPTTPSGHGTHVMGTEVGSDGGSNEIGVAPDARWMASYGCCPDNASLLAALQWHLAPTRRDGSDPDPDQRAHVLQNSWGGPGGSQIFNEALAALKAAGIFVSFSAGNTGNACGSLGSPGDNPATFNVGSSTQSDGVAFSSSRGPDPFSASTGPDLVAPGQSVRSSVPGGLYSYSSGTSMAGPHVAGVVALLWQAQPALIGRVDETAELLRRTAQPIFEFGQVCGGINSGSQHPNNSAGWGRLDVLRAVRAVGLKSARSSLEVQVSDQQGAALPGVQLRLDHSGPGVEMLSLNATTGQDGRSRYLVAAGPATLTATLFGYRPISTSVQIPFQAYLPAVSGADGPAAGPGQPVAGFQPRQAALVLERLPERTLSGLVHEAGAPDKRLDAAISVPGSPVGPVVTDCAGSFSLTLPEGEHSLLVEAVGYEPQRVMVSVGQALTATVALSPAWDYAVADSRTGGVLYDWIDATGGARLLMGDDSTKLVALPAGLVFAFYGQDYEQVYVSSNGFLTFGSAVARFQGVIPFEGQPNNAIYAYGEDLNPGAALQYGTPFDNGVYWLIDGNRLIVQYNEVEHWAQGDPETFEVVLDLDSGEITLQYAQVSWPDFTTVGVENAAGNRGIPFSYANSANLAPGLAVRFSPQFGQPGLSCAAPG